MKKSNNEAAKKALDTQQQPESASDNEESGSITDQSSSMSEQKDGRKHSKTANNTSTATQFSVQRSDTDCLRMRISAIRPPPLIAVGNVTGSKNLELSKESASKQRKSSPYSGDKVNNNTVESHKVKISSKEKQQQEKKVDALQQRTAKSTPSSVDAVVQESVVVAAAETKNAATNMNKTETTSVVCSGGVSATTLTQKSSCLSDATESGCSEATTTTTVAAAGLEKAKKVKVKRRKAQTKANEVKKALKKSRAIVAAAAFTSDSEDDEPLVKPQQQQQRAPRLLLTAINSTLTSQKLAPQLKPLKSVLTTSGTPAHGSDHIGLSSSDNELPDLVSAAMKRIESDTDDTTGDINSFRKAKSKQLPQYQSTLLQDFMEKTQMLGQQTPGRLEINDDDAAPLTEQRLEPKVTRRAELLVAASINSYSDSVASSSPSAAKKRRGRPKKITTITAEITPVNAATSAASNINESADSGVISTTSTTQSTSPSPKMPSTFTNTKTISAVEQKLKQPRKNETEALATTSVSANTSPAKSVIEAGTATKPKIDMAYLDKRMYATERVLYPPPRNKRRQSTSAAAATIALTTATKSANEQSRKSSGAAAIAGNKLNTKEELDPVWRKIDVNKKFRRPSVSGYKSDGGGVNTTICSKILAAKSGYVSDYGSVMTRHHTHASGYKSDASGKSRYSTRSCASRRSRAKSCGYRSDYKESGGCGSRGNTLKSTKFRRKRRCSTMLLKPAKSVGNLNDEQDILQLAGLSLGQSSEESNEFVCKPSLESLPTTSVSKKYGEINRFIATGEYFGRGSSASATTFGSLHAAKRLYDTNTEEGGSQDGYAFSGKLLLQRKTSLASELAHDMLPESARAPRKIKSRRSSVASYCSSYYSGTSRIKRRRRRKSFRFPAASKSGAIDSKLLTEIEIITSTFGTQCRIHTIGSIEKSSGGGGSSSLSGKEKLLAEASKLQSLTAGGGIGKIRDKRALKKRKMSENLDFAMLSASAGSLTPNSGSSKRRHKKASSSSPDDHKLPLKKRHYLLAPGEKSSEAAAVAVAAKIFASNTEAWAAAAATAKTTASTKSQQQFGAKAAKSGLTPKKRHLLQNTLQQQLEDCSSTSSVKGSNSSPLRIVVEHGASTNSTPKLLDISPASVSSSTKQASTTSTEVVHKKRSRLEGLVSKIATTSSVSNEPLTTTAKESPRNSLQLNSNKSLLNPSPQLDSEASCPPPGVFEPSVELEIQIPPIAKLSEAATAIITKSEVDSPLLMDLNKSYTSTSTKIEGTRVVETLLNKTGGNLLLKRKRKKINRTGFPTVRRKKRKITENLLLDVTPDISEQAQLVAAAAAAAAATNDTNKSKTPATSTNDKLCDRVPQTGETSDTFLERANRTPRLSVVALERLQGTPTPSKDKTLIKPRQQNRKHKLEPLAAEVVVEPLPKSNKKTKLLRTEAAEEQKVTSPLRARSRKSKTDLVSQATKPAIKPIIQHATPPTPQLSAAKPVKKTLPLKTESTQFTKSTVHKIITAKSLEAKVKLPAGIDPNTNFSCKIRLKRRSSLHPLVAKELYTPEVIALEAAAKDVHSIQLEHEVLPPPSSAHANDSEATSDTSDEKSSSASVTTVSTVRKATRAKKSYLAAGLFSDYFKVTQSPVIKAQSQIKKNVADKKADTTAVPTSPTSVVPFATALLPPPPYCERYFRRTVQDFELPFDIWWAYTNSKLPTRHGVPSWNYRKIRTNIYAESVRPNVAGLDHPTCNCKSDVGCADHCLNRMVYTECSPSSCPTREKCRNQKIQRHEVAPGVERFMTENKGWGVRTKLPIPKGTYILEYVGEVVTEREFKDRMGTLYLNDIHHYCLHLDGGLVIDGHRMGSDGRFVNHSCSPNCEMQKWSVNGLSRMALFAKRPIKEGEELTYDYNFSLFNPSEGQPCRCNTPQCRGVIGGKSQRIKPLPIEAKQVENSPKESRKNGRQRKRKALKHTQRLLSKDIVVARVQQMSEKERKLVKLQGIFLVRNYEKIRRCKAKRKHTTNPNASKANTPTPTAIASPQNNAPAPITSRRPSTPASLAAQISALCSPRNIKTRGLTLAVQDPEVEKMAKMAVILRDICAALEILKDPNDEKVTLISLALTNSGGNKKKKALKPPQKNEPMNLKTVQANIEQGYYKQPSDFDNDMQKIFTEAQQTQYDDEAKRLALEALISAYKAKKEANYTLLLELIGEETALTSFRGTSPAQTTLNRKSVDSKLNSKTATTPSDNTPQSVDVADESLQTTEDIIRCICGLYKDEGLMIQCARCMVWQHTECTKADVNADNYHCERCEPRKVEREIPLEDFTEEGHRYYLSLLRGTLHVRQGDAVYVLRDIPVKDAQGKVVPSKKHTYETIGDIDYNECDIFRVERLWKHSETGKRFIFGHHFLRPHETFHEPSRRFYPNEVVRVPLYEVVPIELVIGRCWVLDRTTFCKGRPIECVEEEHCYICELRVDKSARFFSKAKVNYPTCTKSYAFKKFPEKLKISKTYAPHDVDPSMLKTKKQKTDSELAVPATLPLISTTPISSASRQELNKTPQQSAAAARKRQGGSISPAVAATAAIVHIISPMPLPVQTIKEKRKHLEHVLKAMKRLSKNTQTASTANETPIDLSYLLSGRGARQRKASTAVSSVPV